MIKKRFYDDYDGYDNYENEMEIEIPSFDDEDEEEDEEKNLKDAIDDDEFLKYFDDARMPISAKAPSTTFKKKKPEIIFEQGEKVTYRNKEATIIFGPYEQNYKKFYEIQMIDGRIISATSTALHKMKK